jgi:hypothetical protein
METSIKRLALLQIINADINIRKRGGFLEG